MGHFSQPTCAEKCQTRKISIYLIFPIKIFFHLLILIIMRIFAITKGCLPGWAAEIIPCEPDAGNAAEGIVPDKRHISQNILLSLFVVTFI